MYQIQVETQPSDQGAGEHMEDIRGVDEAKEEKDLVEVRDKLFATIVDYQDTTHRNAWARCAYHVLNVLSLITWWKTSLYW